MASFDITYFENSQCSFYKEGYSYEMFLRHWGEKIPYLLRSAKPRRALDVGCAKGFLVDQFRSKGIEAYGVDLSAYAVGAAPEKVRPYLKCLDICVEPLPFPDRHFDLVTCLEVIEHLPMPQLALQEIARVLSPHGMAFFSTPSPDEEEEKQDPTHCSIWSFDEWLDCFYSCDMWLHRVPAWRMAGDRGRLGRLPRTVRSALRWMYYPARNLLFGEQNKHLFLKATRRA